MIKGRGTRCGVKRTDSLNLDILARTWPGLTHWNNPVSKTEIEMQSFDRNFVKYGN